MKLKSNGLTFSDSPSKVLVTSVHPPARNSNFHVPDTNTFSSTRVTFKSTTAVIGMHKQSSSSRVGYS